MAHPKIAQVLALAKSKPDTVGLSVQNMPTLGGRFASIDPDEVARYNNAMRDFMMDLVAQLSQALGESRRNDT